jgi:hypothetical protein
MSFTQPWLDVDFGAAHAALGTVGYRLYKSDGSDSVARTTSGVQDISGNGSYGAANVTVPADAVGIEWDTGAATPVYAIEDLEPYRNRAAAAAALSVIKGLVKENVYWKDQVYGHTYQGVKYMTAATGEAYDSVANATTHDGVTGLLHIFVLTATYTDGECTSLLITRTGS